MGQMSDNYNLEDKSYAQLKDFEIKAIIGEGGFGKVFLTQKRDTKEIYAMKQIRKIDMLKHK